MYNTTNKSNKEMVEEICSRLNEHGFTDMMPLGSRISYSTKTGFGAGLMYLPTENLQKMLNTEITDWSSFSKVYEAWGRAGALRFTPYSDHSEDNPSLVLRHNRYLHMFRGYHFQASGTPDGVGDCGSGSYRTDFLTRANYYQSTLQEGFISYMLWWAAYIDVGFQFSSFIKAFNTNTGVLEDFLHESMRYWNREYKYSWKDVSECIKIDNEAIDVVNRKMYQLTDNGKTIYAYVAIGKRTVQVQTANNTWTLTIPDLSLGSGYNLDDEDDKDCYDEEVEILESAHFREMLAVMLLKMAGIHISFTNWYLLHGHNSLRTIRPINSPSVVNVKSLNDIYDATPDEY